MANREIRAPSRRAIYAMPEMAQIGRNGPVNRKLFKELIRTRGGRIQLKELLLAEWPPRIAGPATRELPPDLR